METVAPRPGGGTRKGPVEGSSLFTECCDGAQNSCQVSRSKKLLIPGLRCVFLPAPHCQRLTDSVTFYPPHPRG